MTPTASSSLKRYRGQRNPFESRWRLFPLNPSVKDDWCTERHFWRIFPWSRSYVSLREKYNLFVTIKCSEHGSLSHISQHHRVVFILVIIFSNLTAQLNDFAYLRFPLNQYFKLRFTFEMLYARLWTYECNKAVLSRCCESLFLTSGCRVRIAI